MSSVSTNRIFTSKSPIIYKKFGDDEVFYPTSDGKPMGETDVHIRLIMSLIMQMDMFLKNFEDDYVMGDVLFYYVEGNPRKFIVPDVMVLRGVGKYTRRTYKLWEEKSVPEVVFEISSRGTWREDLQKKYNLYQELGVKEYYIFDPEYDYLPEPLIGYHLKNEKFEEVKVKKRKIFSPALNLEIVDTGETLRLFNPETKSFLPTSEELFLKADELAIKADEFATKAEKLESENKRLKAELEKLKNRK